MPNKMITDRYMTFIFTYHSKIKLYEQYTSFKQQSKAIVINNYQEKDRKNKKVKHNNFQHTGKSPYLQAVQYQNFVLGTFFKLVYSKCTRSIQLSHPIDCFSLCLFHIDNTTMGVSVFKY